MSVENAAFLLDRLGQDCGPLQFLRELTQNSIEAIRRTPEKSGTIIWDVDWTYYDLEGIYKLCIIDTGDGMTGENQVRYINHLSASISEQSLVGNFGVGAKIAAAARNHHGLRYLSWVDGVGSTIRLWRDPEMKQYGLHQHELPSGEFSYWAPVDDTVKPNVIDKHGTMVVLLGNSEDENTFIAPDGVSYAQRWISRYLNRRYFRFPEGIEVKVREFGRTDPSEWPSQAETDMREGAQLRTVHGQKYFLERYSENSGSAALKGATAHWWLLRGDDKLLGNQLQHWHATGHVAALYQDELYEMIEGRVAIRTLQQFGCIFGYRRVVIYIEPHVDAANVTSNTARTQLLLGGESLPWTEWAEEFRANLPSAIRHLEDEILSGTEAKDYSEAIRERLKLIQDLFKLTRYRRTNQGQYLTDDYGPGGTPRDRDRSRDSQGGRTGGRGGRADDLYGLFISDKGDPATPVSPQMPEPKAQWVSIRDGTRATGDLEDRAARYLKDQHELLINSDFRVFTDMIDHWIEKYVSIPGAPEIVPDVVREWYQQQLVETVMGVHALEGSREWSFEDIEKSLSEEALTSAVMGRYHIYERIKRSLGGKLGKPGNLKTAA
jgi:hypothetical protein